MRQLLLIICLLLISSQLAAHGGRTNSEGCHNNRKTGDYHCHNGSSTPKKISPIKLQNPKCGQKYYCKEMTSCSEAQFYYRQCKLYKLDGDNDGIPCENVCQ
ncbi:excalibur calcium-binding domain-containing protein [Kangiella shandongensis]|uniref:excalibur calcium-binding domain-containing protein n=1 Tax=Kangiella shandongensis TaxID=2763258 RepID=UPI001CBED1BA|nr:excalibur calcium-binding domain-containing protein [Kangiella shandongensis]